VNTPRDDDGVPVDAVKEPATHTTVDISRNEMRITGVRACIALREDGEVNHTRTVEPVLPQSTILAAVSATQA